MKRFRKPPFLLPSLTALGLAGATALALSPLADASVGKPDAVVLAPAMPVAQAPKATPDFGKLPLSFEANGGQTDASVHYLSRGQGYALFLTDNEAVIKLAPKLASKAAPKPGAAEAVETSVLRMKLLGAEKPGAVAGTEPQAGTANYFIGNDPKAWKSGVHRYGRVNYQGVYPGVDLVYYGNQRELEYDFIVAPGADASRIALGFDGAKPHLNEQGDLVLPVKGDEVRFHKPVVYQMDGEARTPVDAKYVVAGNETRFQLGAYDHAKPLVIDPVLSYLTYLGGSAAEYIGVGFNFQGFQTQRANGIAVDGQGSIYVTGSTYSTDFPVAGPYQAVNKTTSETIFVSKLNPDGTALEYSTYLGGSNLDYGSAIAIDSAGSAYITGTTISPNFPVTSNAFQKICAPHQQINADHSLSAVTSCGFGNLGGTSGSFVTKLSPDGASLAYSTFIGGAGGGGGYGITVDTNGLTYVTGYSVDSCHPGQKVASASNGGIDVYAPAYLCYPTTTGAFVAGTENDSGSSCDLDQEPCGASTPVSPANYMGEGYLTVFSADGSSLVYSTLLSHPAVPATSTRLGGSFNVGISGGVIAVDSSHNVYIAGPITTSRLSVTPNAFQTTVGAPFDDFSGQIPKRGFVEKFGPVDTGSPAALTYLTYLGAQTTSNYVDYPTGIVADGDGNAYVTGYAGETTFPTTPGAYYTSCGFPDANGNTDPTALCSQAYVSKLKPDGSALVWSTLLGIDPDPRGNVTEGGAIAIDASRNVYVTLSANPGYPQVNPVKTTFNDGRGANVSKLDPTGSTLLFSSSFSDSNGATPTAGGLALDSAGNIYLAGYDYAGLLDVTSGAAQSSYGGGSADGFIVKIVPFAASATSLAVSPASALTGVPVSLIATVAGPTGSSVPTGSVNFANGGTAIGSATLDGTGVATFTSTTLAAGTYSVIATYSGDASYSASVSSAQTLTITAPPVPTVTIAAPPTTILLGATATLTWSSTDATACTASDSWSGAKGTSGTLSVTPTAAGTATYTLTCTGDGGSANSAATLTVTAPPVPTVSVTVNPTSITVGSSATLSWTSTNATSCTASGSWSGSEATSGTLTVTPTAAGTATYTLTCTGSGGSANAAATLTVNAASSGGGSGHGGGGGFGFAALLPLLAAAGLRRRRIAG